MLRTTRFDGNYRDPILLQIWRSREVGERVEDPWFTGYETNPRWLRLQRGGVGMRSINGGRHEVFDHLSVQDDRIKVGTWHRPVRTACIPANALGQGGHVQGSGVRLA